MLIVCERVSSYKPFNQGKEQGSRRGKEEQGGGAKGRGKGEG